MGSTANPLAPVVPGQTPGTTPPILPGAAGNQPNVTPINPVATDDTTQRILQRLIQAAQQRRIAVQPQAPAVPGRASTTPPEYMQKGPQWGFERFASTLAGNIQNAASAHKEKQVQKASADWEYMTAATQELEAAKSSSNPQAIQAAQAKVDAILGDPKKLKNMAKVFQQDWLSPEKTTAYGEAYKRVMAQQQQKQQQQSKLQQAQKMALRKVAQFFRGQQAPQMNPDEQRRMSQEIQNKMPMATPPPDKGDTQVLLESMKEDARRQEDEQKETARRTEEEQKQKFQTQQAEIKDKLERWRTESTQNMQRDLERMRTVDADRRESERDQTMLKALGIRLKDKDSGKINGMTPAQINTEINGSMASMKQQYAQDSQMVRTLKSQLTSLQKQYETNTKGLIGQTEKGLGIMSPPDTSQLEESIRQAESDVALTKKAIDHIEKNRDAIVKGKVSMDDVINQAQTIATGDLSDLGGTAVK